MIYIKKNRKFCVCIPVINEGERIKKQLQEMFDLGIYKIADVLICDGGSKDGSVDDDFLKKMKVKAKLVNLDEKKGLSNQLLTGYHFSVENDYIGVVTVDGNGKDGIEAIPKFIEKLKEGYALLQGSRYLPGGLSLNTPKIRHIAITILHKPVINFISGFKYTDTTNGFRAHLTEVFKDKRIQVFRNIFDTYALIHYLTVRVPQLDYKVSEIAVRRMYPPKGKTLTKISFLRGNLNLLKILFLCVLKKYNP